MPEGFGSVMRVDRERFFVLAVALAAACRSASTPRPARVVDVTPAPGDAEPVANESLRTEAPSALEKRCDTLPEQGELWRETCTEDGRRPFCHTVVAEHRPELAAPIVDCLAQLDSDCAYCQFLLCRWGTINEAEKRVVPACDRIRDEPDGSTWADVCDRYASSLSRRGLEKLTRCLDGAPPPGIECYTEASLTPCAEQDFG